MSDLRSELDRQRAGERATAIRSLLARPVLTAAAQPDEFALVRRHHGELAGWFDTHTGWRLVVEPRQGYARLSKVSGQPHADRPARRPRGNRDPFDRRRYALLCVVAAELLSGQVTTIGILAGRLTEATAVDPDVAAFDSSRYDDRRAYVDALLFLEGLGVLTATDGSTDAYLTQQDAKVLYRVDSTRLTRLLAAPHAPSRLDSPDLAALTREARYGDAADPDAEVAEDQRNLWLRHSLLRRLLDDPVVYYAELTAAERAYAASITGRRMLRAAVAEAGMVLEERAEGMLAVDPDAIATAERFPAEGSVAGQAALLLLDRVLAAHPEPAPMPDLIAYMADRFDSVPAWARTYRSDGGPARLVREALALLTRFRLVSCAEAEVTARPAAARYAIGEVVVARSKGGRS
jgi:uncharacterized protein (TIGR02678 family)